MTHIRHFFTSPWVRSFSEQALKEVSRCSAIAALTAGLLASLIAATSSAQPLQPSRPAAGQTAAPLSVGVLKDKALQDFPAPPRRSSGPLSAALSKAVASIAPAIRENRFPTAAVRLIGQSGDARMAWYLNDLIRLVNSRASAEEVMLAFEQLTGATLPRDSFTAMGDRVLAWNLPSPPGYREMKRDYFY